MPSSFLVQILSDLKQANLVISRRGKTGGYLLATQPNQISLAQIIEAVDSQILEEPEVGQGESAAALHQIWRQINLPLTESLRTTTLDQLATNPSEPMWFI